MPLFGKSRQQKIHEALETIATKVPSMAATIAQSLLRPNALDLTDSLVQWKVHTETLGLLCHLVSRWSFQLGGPSLRDPLQDVVNITAAKATIELSIDSSQAPPDFDLADWQERVTNELLLNIDSAESDYGECTQLIGDDDAWPMRDDNVFGRFAGNVTRASNANEALRVGIAGTVVESISESGLHSDIHTLARVR